MIIIVQLLNLIKKTFLGNIFLIKKKVILRKLVKYFFGNFTQNYHKFVINITALSVLFV